MNKKTNVKSFEELEFKDDFMFGVIMRNPKYCKPFLETSDAFTQELETAVRAVKNNDKWRVEYMTLEMRYRELLEQGYEEGLEDGLEQGISQTITTTISLFRENGFSDRQITEFLINKYKLSPEQAENYIVNI